jgi:hypothetical protein
MRELSLSQLWSVLYAAAPEPGKLRSVTLLKEWFNDIAALIVDVGFRLVNRLSSLIDEGRVTDVGKPRGVS